MRLVGIYDFDLVVSGSGTVTSELQQTFNLAQFSIKCDDDAVWEFDIFDVDGYPIFTSDVVIGPITGTQTVPINRRCAGFYLKLKNATPGTYHVRCNVD